MLPWSARVGTVVVGTMIGCAAASYQLAPPTAPSIGLTLRPQNAFLGPFSAGLQVRATLIVRNPTVEQRCAAELWEWGDMERSGHEEWCVPDELEPWYPGVPMVVSKTHVYCAPGLYNVRVTLLAGEGLRGVASERLYVRGGE